MEHPDPAGRHTGDNRQRRGPRRGFKGDPLSRPGGRAFGPVHSRDPLAGGAENGGKDPAASDFFGHRGNEGGRCPHSLACRGREVGASEDGGGSRHCRSDHVPERPSGDRSCRADGRVAHSNGEWRPVPVPGERWLADVAWRKAVARPVTAERSVHRCQCRPFDSLADASASEKRGLRDWRLPL